MKSLFIGTLTASSISLAKQVVSAAWEVWEAWEVSAE
jgi:hypothetical protein